MVENKVLKCNSGMCFRNNSLHSRYDLSTSPQVKWTLMRLVLTVIMRACGECTKKLAVPLGAHCRQSWPSVATGLYRNTMELGKGGQEAWTMIYRAYTCSCRTQIGSIMSWISLTIIKLFF